MIVAGWLHILFVFCGRVCRELREIRRTVGMLCVKNDIMVGWKLISHLFLVQRKITLYCERFHEKAERFQYV